MVKKYTGSLNLEWFNKNRAVITQNSDKTRDGDINAPIINWINKDESLFYDISLEEGKGLKPYWVNRNDIRVKESRPLLLKRVYNTDKKNNSIDIIENDEEIESIKNLLIKGDNLLALNTLKKIFMGRPDKEKVQCIYIDPPYNIQKAFEHYDDNLEHSEWLSMMRDRLVILKDLLSKNGFIFVQLDDSEGPYGKVLLDEIFGRDNFVVTMYVQVRYDDKTLKEDMKFNKLIEQVHIYQNSGGSKEVNREKVEYTDEKFTYKIEIKTDEFETIKLGGKKVSIFKDGDYEIIKVTPSKKGLKEIWASGSILDGNSSGRFFRDYLTGREKIDGYKTLYRVEGIGDDGLGHRFFTGPRRVGAVRGKYYQGMPEDKQNEMESFKFVPISNFIDLAAYFGNCRHEGGVDFKSGKKPEILISKLFEIATEPGDLILDCFAGSGTSLSVAHKMERNWIGVEIGKHADTHIIKRMKNVLKGDQTGISKEYEWKGGGSFKYYELGSSIISTEENVRDFNWDLDKDFIEKTLLTTYDYTINDELMKNSEISEKEFKVGFLEAGNTILAAIVSLSRPDDQVLPICNEALSKLISVVRDYNSPNSISVFTNRGVEMALDSKPDDVEIIKVPQAIFAELER